MHNSVISDPNIIKDYTIAINWVVIQIVFRVTTCSSLIFFRKKSEVLTNEKLADYIEEYREKENQGLIPDFRTTTMIWAVLQQNSLLSHFLRYSRPLT